MLRWKIFRVGPALFADGSDPLVLRTDPSPATTSRVLWDLFNKAHESPEVAASVIADHIPAHERDQYIIVGVVV